MSGQICFYPYTISPMIVYSYQASPGHSNASLAQIDCTRWIRSPDLIPEQFGSTQNVNIWRKCLISSSSKAAKKQDLPHNVISRVPRKSRPGRVTIRDPTQEIGSFVTFVTGLAEPSVEGSEMAYSKFEQGHPFVKVEKAIIPGCGLMLQTAYRE